MVPFERIEADDWNVGEALLKVKYPASVTVERNILKMMDYVRSRHETINTVGDFTTGPSHNLTQHRYVFAAICDVTQLVIKNSKPLFGVEHDDIEFHEFST